MNNVPSFFAVQSGSEEEEEEEEGEISSPKSRKPDGNTLEF